MAITKSPTIEKTDALALIYNFFKDFHVWCSQSTPIKNSDLEKYLTNNFTITSSGKLVGKSVNEYLKRVQQFQKKYSKFDISKPLEEPVASGNQIAFSYKVDLKSRKGEEKQVWVMAIATIEDNKISRWTQVANEEGHGDWDK